MAHQGADPVDDATAHRIWDNMMGSGWMMMGPGMMMTEDQMRAQMMVGMNAGQWGKWDDWSTCWD